MRVKLAGRPLVSRREASALRRTLRRAARDLVPGDGYEVSIALVDEPEMARLNEMYRGDPVPTDVLSFPQLAPGEEAGPAQGLLGDVVVCVPVAARQAGERGETLLQEMEVLAVHGLLHLLGYEDETPAGASEMATMENDILGRTTSM
ncbi:MAG: rRNA maturation RNase YbeY [Actinobacteria bacterium]|nr:rRNA maturation RNase YbeY [Actinomycetota bacterium]MBU1942837.1 rRNA maturation RNase YbeY [Actinomycetota bacterium]MBU2687569.1 rRNA maturation RNase YbeY [Actinomycetota bacterium]